MLLHACGRGPAWQGLGELLAAPAWFTPLVVCAQQLLSKAELLPYGPLQVGHSSKRLYTWLHFLHFSFFS